MRNSNHNAYLPTINTYDDGIYYLRNTYDRVFKILDTVIYSSDNKIINKALNLFYIGLLEAVKNTLNYEYYVDLKKFFFNHPDNILNLSDELRVEWEEILRSKSLEFMAQLEKAYVKIDSFRPQDEPFIKTLVGIDKAIDHHLSLDYKINQKREQILIKSSKPILYDYKGGLGFLKINNYPTIEFKGVVSSIVNFFYKLADIDDGYKTYRDFENKEKRQIKSSEFSKKIIAINKRVERETSKAIKKIICAAENEKTTETNKYKWRIET